MYLIQQIVTHVKGFESAKASEVSEVHNVVGGEGQLYLYVHVKVQGCAYVYVSVRMCICTWLVYTQAYTPYTTPARTHTHVYVYTHTAISETKYVIKGHTDIASHTAPHQNPMYARKRAHTHEGPPPHCRYRCIPVAGAGETLSCKSAADGFAEDASA